MRGNWGGTGTIPVQCPPWAILSLDYIGRTKQLCCIGSADTKALKPICEDCGLGYYSVQVANGIQGSQSRAFYNCIKVLQLEMIGSSKGQNISLLIEYDEEMVMKYTHYFQ